MTHSQRDSAMLVWLGLGGLAAGSAACGGRDGWTMGRMTPLIAKCHHGRPRTPSSRGHRGRTIIDDLPRTSYYDAEGLPDSPLESKLAVEHEDEGHV